MAATPRAKDPIAVQVGARIKQARQMAGYKTQGELNKILIGDYGWSTGRLGNYEAGQSMPGPQEAHILGKVTGSSECWIMFGAGPIRSRERDVQAIRHQNLTLSINELKEQNKGYAEFLEKAGSTPTALQKYLDNPFKKIGDRQARRFERALNRRKGWLDEQHIDHDPVCGQFPDDMREMMTIYSELPDAEREKLLNIARILKTEG